MLPNIIKKNSIKSINNPREAIYQIFIILTFTL